MFFREAAKKSSFLSGRATVFKTPNRSGSISTESGLDPKSGFPYTAENPKPVVISRGGPLYITISRPLFTVLFMSAMARKLVGQSSNL